MFDVSEREHSLHNNPIAKAMVGIGLAEMACGEIVSIDLSHLPKDDDE